MNLYIVGEMICSSSRKGFELIRIYSVKLVSISARIVTGM
jgi:hypothetical protein